MKNTPLKNYLKENKIEHQHAAATLDITRVYFTQIVNGRSPGKKLAIAIKEWTENTLSLEDILQ